LLLAAFNHASETLERVHSVPMAAPVMPENPVSSAPDSTSRPVGSVAARTLFHYTTEEGMTAILATRRINPSLATRNPHDVRHGAGQYMSDIAPGTRTSSQLSRLFLGMPFLGWRFTNFVEIDVSGLRVEMGRPAVYVIRNSLPLDVTDRIIGFGSN
jgi:hypothetical protein